MQLTIQAKYVPILALFAGKKDIRYYLNGFLATPHKDGGAILVATDGHTLAAIHDTEATLDEKQIRPLPAPMVTACRSKNAKTVSFSDDTATVASRFDSLLIGAKPIDGDFPAWEKVIPVVPKKDWPNFITFAPHLIEKFTKAAGKNGPVQIFATGSTEVALIRIEGLPELLGLNMPIRAEPLGALPDWFTSPTPAKKTRKPARKKAA